MKKGIFRIYDDDVKEKIACYLKKCIPKNKNITIVCVGTDRIIGDAVGPLVGTLLKEYNINANVIGEFDNLVNATNVRHIVNTLNTEDFIIAIDACVTSRREYIGCIIIDNEKLYPGLGLDKKLPGFGDLTIKAVVAPNDVTDKMMMLGAVRLSFVYKISTIIVRSLLRVIGVK